MGQLEHIEAIEKRLWGAADTLRSNSNYASNEYFMPVMGLIFLRHAYSRYLAVKDEIIANLPKRGGKVRELKKEDFSQRSAIFLRPEAQFDYLVALGDDRDRAKAVIEAMESIESDYTTLKGELPKQEYQELDNEVLGQLLRSLNPEELKQVKGDVFGRIYEYFLTQFADLKAHDNGEFFTPVSLVSLIANVLEPDRGILLDPACGSGGMFVQSAHFVEDRQGNPHSLTFKGLEKNPTTIRLAKMNLAVHGLEGDMQKAITYYEDPHELLGKANFVMANPPFNVDEVDEEKVKNDPRLLFGLPSVNKNKKISNGNYLWITYFYSYLTDRGRAGFVMSSQASSAGGTEATVRQKLIGTGDVEMMVAIRSNFFYTRTVPCELWFFNRAKLPQHKDHVLMLDARNIYRKVTRKIYDFSPEQLQNLLAIVWLYRGQEDKFLDLVRDYLDRTLSAVNGCFESVDGYTKAIALFRDKMTPFVKGISEVSKGEVAPMQEFEESLTTLIKDVEVFRGDGDRELALWQKQAAMTNADLNQAIIRLAPLAETSRDFVKQADLVYKLGCRVMDWCEKEQAAKDSDRWSSRDVTKERKAADLARQEAVEQLKLVRYFHKQAVWLTERFPDGKYRDVQGLVKLVDHAELAANDWSLTPGRYVGVAPEEVDEDFDFEETLRDIHIELEGLNAEAVDLAAAIAQNFKELGI
ncbi:DNA methyltransferase [Pseudanabaena sp. SR411]|uniref:class I SAM-dependent DNA methyltransferase n=1 Tax=Pseudanabaena sp. SR411 TaxID=1980935 RepID=UPI000B99BCC3|nr:N-6 DNA methylase [Pseudanabaena sp. SR411]OYQ65536.1 DNA methyltransferase [Pseudanabaena sp. SR411]